MPEKMLQPGDRDFVGALASGLSVLQAFNNEHPKMTLSEVAARTSMDRAKARRFLLTLHALGYVKQTGRQFELTPRMLELGHAYQSSNQYTAIIQKHLEAITAELGESSSMGILDRDDVVYIVRSAAKHRLLSINLSTGARLPAAYTSMGRALLSQLPDEELEQFLDRVELKAYTDASVTNKESLRERILLARKEGFAILDQELDSGLRSVSTPIYSGRGDLLGAINISTNAARISIETLLDVFIPRLKSVAETIRRTTQ